MVVSTGRLRGDVPGSVTGNGGSGNGGSFGQTKIPGYFLREAEIFELSYREQSVTLSEAKRLGG